MIVNVVMYSLVCVLSLCFVWVCVLLARWCVGADRPHWFAGCGMLVAGGFCYGRLLDESYIARESQNSPAPARASDRLLNIWLQAKHDIVFRLARAAWMAASAPATGGRPKR
jgi:hypothetical protein